MSLRAVGEASPWRHNLPFNDLILSTASYRLEEDCFGISMLRISTLARTLHIQDLQNIFGCPFTGGSIGKGNFIFDKFSALGCIEGGIFEIEVDDFT
jgi:hypothetical protein